MDKNRLIQIANHFDKIGAYTISDEFENKFIRMAAPLDTLSPRNKDVQKRIQRTTGQSFFDIINRFNPKTFSLTRRSPADILNFNKESSDLLVTWLAILTNFTQLPEYSSDPKKLEILQDATLDLDDAEKAFIRVKPRSVAEGAIYGRIVGDTSKFANDDRQILQFFAEFVDGENAKYTIDNKYNLYLNKLRDVENKLYQLDQYRPGAPTPAPAPKPTPAPAPKPTPAPAAPGGSRTTPAKPVPAPTNTKPVQAPAKPSSGGSGGTSPVGPGKASTTKPTSTKPSKSKEDDANKELSKIVFRKYKAAHPKVEDRDILLGMRITESFTLKTYFDITKEPSLDGSIRAAIKASPYSPYFKETMLKIYESKLRAAKEKNSEPTKPVVVTPEKPSGGGESKTETKTDTKTEEKKNDDFGLRCNREGLFTEIKRMDTLHGNDPDKYMRNYFADIKRVIDCHESIRNSLNHKDNIQLDTSINILEAKYFSLINRTQFPY